MDEVRRMRGKKYKRRSLAAGLVTLLLTGCPLTPRSQTAAPAPPVQIKHAPATPIALKKAELGDDETWDPAWDRIIETALPDDLLWSRKIDRDVRAFCPRYGAMSVTDRRTYWAYFFQALAGAEAGLRATADVRHTEPEVAVRDGVTHRMVRAEGLLQLTYEDANRYGCDFDWTQDKHRPAHDPGKTILDPRNNLLCGVRILHSQLVDRDKAAAHAVELLVYPAPRMAGLQHVSQADGECTCSVRTAARSAQGDDRGKVGPVAAYIAGVALMR